ncbi:MAG: rhodanese-like domain-containing protein [Lachnospiraceae bacterium]|nr:rhodanese-like domain-containing protein [Lachnospiraceae bacterium]
MEHKNFKTVIILAVMGTLCINGCHTSVSGSNNRETENAYMKISAEEAKEVMDNTDSFLLVDVREADEYAYGHIEGALLIPYGEIGERAETELPDKEQTILVYCRSGRRSSIAAQTLTDLGYTDVRDFGGIIDWSYDKITD